ncbi:N-acetylmuramoyl-L-alanine amidase [Bombilactobacillus folatiphilus]|uniref:N-acetylmuramoyl-L-alanine amidase n=1 Tax=Bombilactobacillus folatiphilus TaxID=2923362 RepID=A0ABY4P7F3_9LACO|nr:N-acetylmuramoyl-L-alanine amidase [Bombilactobacillus folatiphilus]UQS81539.1 N-acetylmuramoyl-L-alanine amidase [Bombilactobacillus folatiphilus]
MLKRIQQLFNIKNYNYAKFLLIFIFFITASYSTIAVAQSNQMIVKANFLNVRMGPSLSYDTIAQVKRGEKLTIIDEKNDWYQVRIADDKIGWVASWLINNNDANTSSNTSGVIKAPNTNVQKYPQKDSEVLGTLSQSQKVNIVYSQNDWSQIIFNQTVGWIPNSELIITDKVPDKIQQNQTQQQRQTATNIQSVTTLQNNTRIFKNPSTNAKIIAHITDQTTLPYLGRSGKFYKVRLNSGDEGYIPSGLVSISDTKYAIKTAATKLAEATIVLDAGHGGSDPGALSSNQKHEEKNYTIQVVKLLQQKLQQTGANVVLTRSQDQSVPLADRARLANKLNADVFISIHFDAAYSGHASGLTTYYYSGKKDRQLAKNISAQLKTMPLPNRGTHFGNYEVLRENEQPAILVEGGYLDNNKDYQKIKSPKYQAELADAIYQGLIQHFK